MFEYLVNSTAKVTLVILAFIILIVLNLFIWKKDHDQEREIISLQKELLIQQQENAAIAQSNAQLRQKINSLKQGSMEMIEEEARSGFGMVGEGETYFHFEDKPKPEPKPEQ